MKVQAILKAAHGILASTADAQKLRLNTKKKTVCKWRFSGGSIGAKIATYFEKPQRYTRHMHPLAYRQIQTCAVYFLLSFYSIKDVPKNKLPSEIALRDDLDPFK